MARIEIGLSQGWTRGLTLCFEDVESSLALDVTTELFCKQVHGTELHPVSFADLRNLSPLKEADGLVAEGDQLKEMKKKLCVFTADCLPLIFVDHRSEKLAIVHAGWRGLARGMHMLPFRDFAFKPESTWVWVGPHIHQEDFEVGSDVVDSFSHLQDPWNIFTPAQNSEKWNFSMLQYLQCDFDNLGVELVYDVGVNTYRDLSFASYRRTKHQNGSVPHGRNISWVAWMP